MISQGQFTPIAVIPEGRAARGLSGIHPTMDTSIGHHGASAGSRITRFADAIVDRGRTGVRDDDKIGRNPLGEAAE